PVTPGQSFWMDVNGDHLPDEVFPRGAGGFSYVLDDISAVVDVDISATFNWGPFNSWFNNIPGWIYNLNGQRDYIGPDAFNTAWGLRPVFDTTVTVICDVVGHFPTVAGERYGILRQTSDDSWLGFVLETIVGTGVADSFVDADLQADMIDRYYLVRYGKAGDVVPFNEENPFTWPALFREFYFRPPLDAGDDDMDLDSIIFSNSTIPMNTFVLKAVEILQNLPQHAENMRRVVEALRNAVAGALTIEAIQRLINRMLEKKSLPYSFITYEMPNFAQQKYYVGRTHGPGDPNSVLRRRLINHQNHSHPAYRKPKADGWDRIIFNAYHHMSNWDPGAFCAMRGREQSVIDSYKTNFPTRVLTNIDRAVRWDNPLGRVYYDGSRFYFAPQIHSFTGDPSLPGGGLVPILWPILGTAWYPLNHGVRSP
ncbi:MAG: hypothetical protein V4773_02210, partial [Verrucomicrobiota bacterium]